MKTLLTLSLLLVSLLSFSQSETLLYYDRIESGNWAGGWYIPSTTSTT